MAVLAIQIVRALVPVAILLDIWALVKRAYEVEVRWPPEVLLPVGVVAVRPLMFLIYYGAKARLVSIYHELLKTHLLLEGVQILRESPFIHKSSDSAALFRAKWQRINFLFLFIEWLYSLLQVASTEGVQLVRR